MANFKKTAALVASYALVGALAIGGTMALTYDSESKMNILTSDDPVDIVINEYQTTNGVLEEFEQGKKLNPIVGSAQGEKDAYGFPVAENYVDKGITIKNTGETDAYVRVFFGVPAALEDLEMNAEGNESDNALHTNLGNRVDLTGQGLYNGKEYNLEGDTWNWAFDSEFQTEIDGVTYNIYCYNYNGVVEAGDETRAVIAGAYLDSRVDYDNGKYTMDGIVIDYDLSEGVVLPVYAEASASEITTDPASVFGAWVADNDAVAYVNGEVEINKTVILADADTATDCVTATGENTVVTITDGYYDAGNKDCAVWAYGGATVNIEGGTFTCGAIEGEVSSANHSDLIYAGSSDGTAGTINISGGYFYTETAGDWILNERDGVGTIVVTGGTFVNWNPDNNVSEGAGTSFLADGYKVEVTQSGSDTIYTVVAE